MILAIIHSPEITKDKYEALRPIVQWEKNHPEGILFHAAAFDEQGRMHVVDVWESPEQMEAFFTSRLLPGLQQLGITPPQPSIYPAFNVDAYPGIEKLTP